MNTIMKKTALVLAGAGILTAAMPVLAEQTQDTGNGALTTSARLNFRVVIPRFIRFGVGTGAALTGTSTTVDLVSFEPTLDEVGSGTALPATSNGTVNVALVANGGAVSITATNSLSGGLSDGASTPEFIPFTDISATTSDNNFPAPAIPNNGSAGTAAAVPLGGIGTIGNKVTRRTASWTFSYANTSGMIPSAGTYGETAVKGGQVTYIASMP
jgi:hypothetical protein